MAKLPRVLQKIFGSSAGPNQIAKFGSLQAGTPVYTTDPLLIQGLSNYLGGWFSGVIGNNSPAIEDMNALFYLFSYQLAYIMQQGVPEWDATTTYYIGGIVNDGTGTLYRSLQNTNLNHATSDGAWWAPASGAGGLAGALITTSGTSTNNTTEEIDTTAGAITRTLPLTSQAASIEFNDRSGACSAAKYIRITPGAGDSIAPYTTSDSLVLRRRNVSVKLVKAAASTVWYVTYQTVATQQPGVQVGYTGSVAIGVGYIGERIDFTFDAADPNLNSGTFESIYTGTLNKGVYQVFGKVTLLPTGVSTWTDYGLSVSLVNDTVHEQSAVRDVTTGTGAGRKLLTTRYIVITADSTPVYIVMTGSYTGGNIAAVSASSEAYAIRIA